MNKKEIAQSVLARHSGLLACPVCRGRLDEASPFIYRCPAGHAFDMASQGYLNLLAASARADYGADLFEHRRVVLRNGFFDGLLAVLAGEIAAAGVPAPVVLDAGCGEGTPLVRLLELCRSSHGLEATGCGVDLSRDGVRNAAREYPGAVWLVGDLARLPVGDNQVDAVLNILSPANYGEFERVLKPGGLLIKVVPGEGYLGELRRALYDDDRREYANDRVLSHFLDRYPGAAVSEFRETRTVEGDALLSLTRMTPLAWRADEARIALLLAAGSLEVTVEFEILIARRQVQP